MAKKRPRPDGIKAGDTFLVTHASYNHLQVVCSDPALDAGQVLLVSITTMKPKEEECCILAAGEHPFIKHRSCVRYKEARIVSAEDILRLLAGPYTSRREPVSEELLARIRQGASDSDYLPEGCRQLLQNQRLI